MPRHAPTTARKKPRQARSQATVDTLLDATARVLVTTGYDRASTNRVADVAGGYFIPQLGAFVIYAVMVALLVLYPRGLFGRRE